MNDQITLFKENKEVRTTEDIEKDKEESRLLRLCCVCKKEERTFRTGEGIRNMCDGCAEKYLNEIFKNCDIPNGFRDEGDKYIFYSMTTGAEEVGKDNVLTILEKDRIQTCDKFGCFENCYGITEEFADYVIKDLKLVEKDGTWENKKIIPNEKEKKINELKKELAIKRVDMMETLKKIRELENEI